MNAIDLTPIMQLVITFCVGLATRYFLPWMKAKAGQERTARLFKVACIAVKAAEQMYGGGVGSVKLDYALKHLKERGFHVSADELRATVEAAVYEMNNAVMEQTDAIGFDTEGDT